MSIPVFQINPILIAAAVIPAIILLIRIEKADRLEKESPRLLASLVLFGIISTAIAEVLEMIGITVLDMFFEEETVLYDVLLYFGIVAFAEEGAKYVLLKRRTWKNPEFNCQFDGVVYGVFVSLGFALWENIGYVMTNGLGTALLRALTAVPGHACFGVFMGVWYGAAKRRELYGETQRSKRLLRLSVIVPALLHGCYDFIASLESEVFVLVFIVFVLAMFITALRIVRRASRRDDYM